MEVTKRNMQGEYINQYMKHCQREGPIKPCTLFILFFFIGPESDHCLPLSVTEQVTHSCLVDFIDVTLAFEDANSKHVVLKSILLYKVQLFQKHLLAAVLDEVK